MKTYTACPETWQIRLFRDGSSGESVLTWEDSTPFGVEMYGQELVFPEGIIFIVKYDWHEGHLCVILSVRMEAEGECAKCLKPLRQEIEGSLRYIFLSGDPQENFQGMEEEEEIVVVHSLERGVLLREQLWETFLESLPRILLCREDCRGICPECGADRNEHPCSCADQRIDPRLASLQAMHFFEEEGGK